MSNNANVYVSFGDNDRALIVKCEITFDIPVSELSFSLSTLLTVDNIVSDKELKWETTKKWKPQWQHESNEIEVSSKTPMQKLIIEYHGRIAGWCNVIEEKKIALSAYSAWAINASLPIKYLFKINNMEDYFVINARYDTAEKMWVYGETEHDVCNIIALKKGYYHVANTGNLYFYYICEAEKEYADCYISNYDSIMEYFTSIFGKKDINKMSVVSLGLDESGGAYFRNELMVICKIDVSENKEKVRQSVIGLLGHELGHNWFTGANTSTWEDWLNETGAEWAGLLYILSLKDNELFNNHLSNLLSWNKNYTNMPVIKSLDGKRPAEGVHIRGVMMFREIYLKYGIDTIITILRIFLKLEKKTTEEFLSVLRVEIGNEIPDKIEQGLTMNEYSGLFA